MYAGEPGAAKACLSDLRGVIDPQETFKSEICFKDKNGEALLQRSAMETHAMGVRWSCTIWVAGDERCASGGRGGFDAGDADWAPCASDTPVEDFVGTVCTRLLQERGVLPRLCLDAGLRMPGEDVV